MHVCDTFPTALPQAKPEDTLDLCRLINDDLAATIKKHPDRFVGLGTLPMQAPDLAVQELRRCKNELGEYYNTISFLLMVRLVDM